MILVFKPTVDLFSDEHNHIVEQYVTRYDDEKGIGVDGLIYPLKMSSIYAYPPFKLINPFLSRLSSFEGSVIYLHHEFDGANYMFVKLKRMFQNQETRYFFPLHEISIFSSQNQVF